MRKSLILLLMLPCFTLQSQNLFEVNIDSSQKEFKKCIKLWESDTIFLKNTDSEVHLQVWNTRINDSFRWLSQEMKLTKSENPKENKSFFSFLMPSRNKEDYSVSQVSGVTLSSYKNYQNGYLIANDTFGNLLLTYQIKDGYLNGSFQVFYPDGELFSIGNYYEHAKSGHWVWFSNDKKIMMEGEYYPEVLMYSFNSSNEESFKVDKFGKKFILLETMDFTKYLNTRPFIINSFPAYIEYRDKNWTIYDRNHKVVKKKKYNKTPVILDNEFDTYFFEEMVKN